MAGRPPHDDILTPAEWRVVEFIRHGLSTAKIAHHLAISPDAVKFHADNIKAKLGLPDRKAIRHWAGQRKGSAMTAGNVEPLGPLGQISRQVENLDRARDFLKTLGLTELFAFPPMAFFDLGGTRLMLKETGKREAADILYFRTSDIQADHARLSALGITFSGAPHMIHRHADGTEEWMAFFTDDENRPLALIQQSRPA